MIKKLLSPLPETSGLRGLSDMTKVDLVRRYELYNPIMFQREVNDEVDINVCEQGGKRERVESFACWPFMPPNYD